MSVKVISIVMHGQQVPLWDWSGLVTGRTLTGLIQTNSCDTGAAQCTDTTRARRGWLL